MAVGAALANPTIDQPGVADRLEHVRPIARRDRWPARCRRPVGGIEPGTPVRSARRGRRGSEHRHPGLRELRPAAVRDGTVLPALRKPPGLVSLRATPRSRRAPPRAGYGPTPRR